MTSENQAQLIDEAAHWAVRLASSTCTAQEREAAEAWRNRSAAHQQAWQLAMRVDDGMAKLSAADAELMAMADAALIDSAAPRRSHRRTLTIALAAGVAAAGVFLTSLLVTRPDGDAIARYESEAAADGRRTVSLADGSVVQLDVGSAIEVELSRDLRRIVLLRGRAMFAVAHDASRPFSVLARDGRTVALGTRFQVELRGESAAVTLTEGSVSVTGLGSLDGQTAVLQPGEQLRYSAQQPSWDKRAVDVQAVTGWERGRLVFHGTPLSEALDEVNRYADQRIRLADPALASLPVNGNFIAGDSHLVASALVQTLPISARDEGREIILTPRSD